MKDIALIMHRSEHQIRRIIKNHDKYGHLGPRPGSGRKRKTSTEEDDTILEEASRHSKSISGSTLHKLLGLKNISERTVRRRMKEHSAIQPPNVETWLSHTHDASRICLLLRQPTSSAEHYAAVSRTEHAIRWVICNATSISHLVDTISWAVSPGHNHCNIRLISKTGYRIEQSTDHAILSNRPLIVFHLGAHGALQVRWYQPHHPCDSQNRCYHEWLPDDNGHLTLHAVWSDMRLD